MEPDVKRRNIPSFWLWVCILLAVLALISGMISAMVGVWIKIPRPGATPPMTPAPITTLQVKRTAAYAGLDITVLNAQYATVFVDDTIHPGPATARLNLNVANHGTDQPKIVYYDSARLLGSSLQPIAPTNTNLSSGPKPGASETGWLDFAVPQGIQLDTLTLQLGSTAMSEALVKLPFKGPFDGSRYSDKIYSQHTTFSYTFNGQTLNYHLTSVEIRYAYEGSQCKVGQQFYVFNFAVDNPSDIDANPGFGFDYLRMMVNGYSQPPIDTSLPNSFKAGANGVAGHVVFTGPAGLHTFTLGFLSQNGSGQQNFYIHVP